MSALVLPDDAAAFLHPLDPGAFGGFVDLIQSPRCEEGIPFVVGDVGTSIPLTSGYPPTSFFEVAQS